MTSLSTLGYPPEVTGGLYVYSGFTSSPPPWLTNHTIIMDAGVYGNGQSLKEFKFDGDAFVSYDNKFVVGKSSEFKDIHNDMVVVYDRGGTPINYYRLDNLKFNLTATDPTTSDNSPIDKYYNYNTDTPFIRVNLTDGSAVWVKYRTRELEISALEKALSDATWKAANDLELLAIKQHVGL